jgi:hypothetical protein
VVFLKDRGFTPPSNHCGLGPGCTQVRRRSSTAPRRSCAHCSRVRATADSDRPNSAALSLPQLLFTQLLVGPLGMGLTAGVRAGGVAHIQFRGSAAASDGGFALSAKGWGITPQGDAAVPSPLAGWDRYATPFADWNVTPRFFLQTSLAAESAGLTAHRDGAPVTSPARSRPRLAIEALPRAFDGVRRSKPDSGGSVPAIDAPAVGYGWRGWRSSNGPQSVMAGGGGDHPILRKVAAKKDSTQAPPDAAQRAATAHSSVAVAGAEGRENLPSTYFVPMALRTRSAGEKSRPNLEKTTTTRIKPPFDLRCILLESAAESCMIVCSGGLGCSCRELRRGARLL